ncbi:MAG: hypothetical protein J7K08_06425 [Thermoplasmata archaeon]|nr:hypothetical protein [Thermoplasmata archaeon]HDD60678.1 hypothetical protein [Euryarchaeota archaeon]RLF53484.1 MAG: hypothetical protein DRN28_06985 [Thermoplasmata archaeon]RLF68539.1 MAG: hypothetical protein DRN40_07480 [Thermoplasmata archaeon]RLF70565.1 MAG: hypothetical protein DRN55_08435 [Thermoplasmata archaeon]
METEKMYCYRSGEVVIFIPAVNIREARSRLPEEISRYLASTPDLPPLQELGFLEGVEEDDSMVVFIEDLLREAGIDFFFEEDDL